MPGKNQQNKPRKSKAPRQGPDEAAARTHGGSDTRLAPGEQSLSLRVRLKGEALALWKELDATERGRIIRAGMQALDAQRAAQTTGEDQP